MKDVSAKSGETGTEPASKVDDGPSKTTGPASVNPTSELEAKQNKAMELLGKLQDNVQGIRELMEKHPVSWDQVKLKFAHSNDLMNQLKELGASSDPTVERPMDMSGVDDDFYSDLDQADGELRDLRGTADEQNPDFEALMQQPYVDEPEDSR